MDTLRARSLRRRRTSTSRSCRKWSCTVMHFAVHVSVTHSISPTKFPVAQLLDGRFTIDAAPCSGSVSFPSIAYLNYEPRSRRSPSQRYVSTLVRPPPPWVRSVPGTGHTTTSMTHVSPGVPGDRTAERRPTCPRSFAVCPRCSSS